MTRRSSLILIPILACALPAAEPKFDVASIKLNPQAHEPGDNAAPGFLKSIAYSSRGGRFSMEGPASTPLSLLIQLAYNVQEYQVLGGPSWVNSAGYDITANAGNDSTFEQMRPMIRSLLADRFKLALRHETRELPVYELTTAKGGAKITALKAGSCATLDPDNPPPPPDPSRPRIRYCGGIVRRMNSFEATAVPMPKLVELLSEEVGRTVVDKTGLTGNFDFQLDFVHDVLANNDAGAATGTSIFTALQDQLGLRLESAKGPVEALVIDHVERPSAN